MASPSAGTLSAARWTGPTIVFLAILAKGLAFLREPIIASTLGASSSTDAYYVAIGLPFILFNLLGLPFALWVTARLAAVDLAHGQAFYRRSLWFGLTLSSLVSISLTVLARPIVHFYAVGLDGHRLAEAVLLTQLAGIALPALVLQALVSGQLFAERRFAAVYAWLAVGGLTGLLGVIILTPSYGARGATFAFVGTWWVSAIGLLFSSYRQGARSTGMVATWREELGAGIVYRAVAMQIFFQGGALLTYSFASRLTAGEIAATLFASKITMAIYETLVLTSGVVVFPQIARFVQEGNEPAIGRALMRALEWLIPVTVVLVVLLALGRTEIVAIIYSRRAFDERALGLVSRSLVGFAPYVVGVALIEMLHRAMVLRGRLLGYLAVFGVGLLVNALVGVLLVPRVGITGVSLGSSLGALAAGCGLWAYANNRLQSLDSKRMGLLALRTLAGGAVAFAVVTSLQAYLVMPPTVLGRVLQLAGTMLAGIAAFVGAMFGLGYRLPFASATEEG